MHIFHCVHDKLLLGFMRADMRAYKTMKNCAAMQMWLSFDETRQLVTQRLQLPEEQECLWPANVPLAVNILVCQILLTFQEFGHHKFSTVPPCWTIAFVLLILFASNFVKLRGRPFQLKILVCCDQDQNTKLSKTFNHYFLSICHLDFLINLLNQNFFTKLYIFRFS